GTDRRGAERPAVAARGGRQPVPLLAALDRGPRRRSARAQLRPRPPAGRVVPRLQRPGRDAVRTARPLRAFAGRRRREYGTAPSAEPPRRVAAGRRTAAVRARPAFAPGGAA